MCDLFSATFAVRLCIREANRQSGCSAYRFKVNSAVSLFQTGLQSACLRMLSPVNLRCCFEILTNPAILLHCIITGDWETVRTLVPVRMH